MNKVLVKSGEEHNHYALGQIFEIEGKPFILAQVESKRLAMVSLIDGNRWNDPIKVDCDLFDIPPKVVEELLIDSYNYKRLGKCNITITPDTTRK